MILFFIAATIYKLEPRMKFFYQAHHSKPSHVGLTCQIISYHVWLEDIHNQDPYVLMYIFHYGQKQLFNEHISSSQHDDYELNAFGRNF